jgi:hypothetical protein
MVYFEQHVVLPPDTRDRLDKLLDLLSEYHHKLPSFSSPITPNAAFNALKSINHTIVNVELILCCINVFNLNVRVLTIIRLLFLVQLIVLIVFRLSVGYLVWTKDISKKCAGCQCIKDEKEKIK